MFLLTIIEQYHDIFKMSYLFSFILIFSAAGTDSLLQDSEQITFSLENNMKQQQLADLLSLNSRNSTDEPLIYYTIQNNAPNSDWQVYLEVLVSSQVNGELYKSVQNRNRSFTVPAGETFRFSDLDIINGNISGDVGAIQFDFVLNSRGRTILSRLNRGAVADDQTYSIQASLFAEQSESDEIVKIAEDSTVFVTRLPEDELVVSVDSVVNEQLSNTDFTRGNPVFEWKGRENLEYRLILVRNHDSIDPDEVLNNRFSRRFSESSIHDPVNFVHLDVIHRGTRYTVPDNYRQFIEPGHDYTWQVRAYLPTISGEVEITSEPATFATGKLLEGELMELLTIFLGEKRVEQLIQDGLQLHRLEINGMEYTAHEAVQYLREMKSKMNKRKATIGG